MKLLQWSPYQWPPLLGPLPGEWDSYGENNVFWGMDDSATEGGLNWPEEDNFTDDYADEPSVNTYPGEIDCLALAKCFDSLLQSGQVGGGLITSGSISSEKPSLPGLPTGEGYYPPIDYGTPTETPPPTYVLYVEAEPPEGGGAVCGDETSGSVECWYREGEEAQIRATPVSGWQFDHWETTGGTLWDPYAADTLLSMPAGNVTVTAYFEEVVGPAPCEIIPGAVTDTYVVSYYVDGSCMQSYDPNTGSYYTWDSYSDTCTVTRIPGLPWWEGTSDTKREQVFIQLISTGTCHWELQVLVTQSGCAATANKFTGDSPAGTYEDTPCGENSCAGLQNVVVTETGA